MRSGFWLVHITRQSKTDLSFCAEAQKRLPISWLDALYKTTPPKPTRLQLLARSWNENAVWKREIHRFTELNLDFFSPQKLQEIHSQWSRNDLTLPAYFLPIKYRQK